MFPRNVEYVMSRVFHTCNMILHAWHTRDVTYSSLRGTWSTRTRVTCADIPHNLHVVIVHELYMHEHMYIYGTAI